MLANAIKVLRSLPQAMTYSLRMFLGLACPSYQLSQFDMNRRRHKYSKTIFQVDTIILLLGKDFPEWREENQN